MIYIHIERTNELLGIEFNKVEYTEHDTLPNNCNMLQFYGSLAMEYS